MDVQTSLGLSLLSHILLATPASPLKKTLIESGLGEDVIGGFDEQLRQTMFSAGLKGIQQENLEKVEQLILATLNDLAQNGLDPDTVAASMNTIEFALREQNTGRFPRGLSLMLAALTTWLYDGDPLEALAFEAPLNGIKTALRAPRYFESLIQKYLIENPHRATVSLIPDPEEGKRRESIETERLQKAKAAMSAGEIEKVIAEAAELKQRQETPDSPEALATIPQLSLADIEKTIRAIPIEVSGGEKTPIFHHDLFTNGIVYLDLGFDLHSLPGDLLPYAGLFGRLLLEMGTEKDDFVRLTQRIGRNTGGIRSSSLNSAARESDRAAAWFFLRGKAVAGQSAALLDILEDILLTARFDNRERFRQIVLERKAGLEAGLVPGGSGVVNQRLRARLNQADWVSEQMHGIAHLFFLRELAEAIESDWNSVLEKLETLRRLLVNRSALIANVTLDAANWQTFKPQLEGFIERLPVLALSSAPVSPLSGSWENWTTGKPGDRTTEKRPNEGLTIPAQVNYVGKGANLYKLGYHLHGSVQVINNYLHTTWLWEKIRVQGGAYGGQSAFDIHSGVFTYLSYRDPNLLASLDIYDATASFLRSLDLSEAELTKAIIGTIGDLDAYLLPDAKGWISMSRHLLGYTDAHRQQYRNQVLGTTTRDFKAFGEVLAEAAKVGEIVVLGSADAIEKANKERAGLLEVRKAL